MVQSGGLAENPIVGVFQMPADDELAWRSALANAAVSRGWAYAENPEDFAAVTRTQPVLLVTSDPKLAQDPQVTSWVVLHANPWAAASLLVERLGMGSDSLWHIATRCAVADALIRKGAQVFLADGSEVVVPLLGSVSNKRASPAPISRKGVCPLDIYSTLPVMPGASSVWGGELFKLPAKTLPGLDPIDVTGRARLLIQGPYLDLSPGGWRIDATIDVDTQGGSIEILLEWGVETNVSSSAAVINRPGRYTIRLEHEWAVVAPADFRIILTRPSFQGQLIFVTSSIERLQPPFQI